MLAMLGEQFMVGEEICGAVVSIRFQEDILRSDDANKFSLNCFLLFFRFSTFSSVFGTGLPATRL